MNDEAYDDALLEKEIKARFGIGLDIAEMIVRRIPAGPAIWGSVFLTNSQNIYAYIEGTKTMTLGDVKRILIRMGLRADRYFPPRAQENYFTERAKTKYKEVFPGRPVTNDNDLVYYKSLVPYSPALVSILEITDGKINQYDTDAASSWRVNLKFKR